MRAPRIAVELLLPLAVVSGCGSGGSSASSGDGGAAGASAQTSDASDGSTSSTAEGPDAAAGASPACPMTMASVSDAGGCTVNSGGNVCSSSQYGMACRVPRSPDPSLGCQQVPVPTGQYWSIYCCPCGQ